MEKLKINRRNRKGNLTRVLKELECLLENGATEESIRKVIAKAQSRFESIEQCHDELVELIEKDEDYEKEQAWITECQQEYMTEMIRVEKLLADSLESQTKLTKDVNQSNQVPNNEMKGIKENSNESGEVCDANISITELNEATNDRGVTRENDSNGECGLNGNSSSHDNKVNDNLLGFFKTLSLPKPQVKQFDGDPLHYHAFMSTYMNMVADIVDDNVKLNTLMSLCVGRALESIQYCVLKTPSDGFRAAIETLKYRFGNTSVVVQAWIGKILARPKVDSGKISEYADDLNNCFEALSALGYVHELNNQSSLKQIVEKLPRFLQNRWQGENYRLKMNGLIPGLQNIVKFVKAAAMEINDPVFGSHENWSSPTPPTKLKRNQVNSTSVTQQGDRKFPKCWLCKSDQHWPDQCETLRSMEVEARLEAAKANHVCFSCLKVAGRNHKMSNCSRRRVCGVKDGTMECQKTHNRLLHCVKDVTANQSILDGFEDSLLSVLDVEVLSKGRNVLAKVMLDSGSQGTFIREDFVKELGIKGRPVSACITKVGGTKENFESRIYDISLRGIQSGMLHEIKALGLKTINKVKDVDTKKLETLFQMKPGTFHRHGGDIDILIGVDNAKLLTGKTVKLGGLIAQNSPLGWTVFGGCNNDQVHSSIMHVKISKAIDLTDFWTTEAMGVESGCNCKVNVSSEDADRKLLEDSCVKVGNRWLIPYPWVKDPNSLSDNRGQAVKMLQGLENRLKKEASYGNAYQDQVTEMVGLGFARKLTKAEIEEYKGPVHYIPHHPVIRPDKKTTPVRIVFNSSNRYNGEALNDYWLKGPDLLNNLHGVIARFREHPIALCGDIEKMYHQVRIPELDQHVHRFLWRDLDNTREPDTYMKTVLTFGDRPAPAMALTALKMTAKEGENSFPKAAEVLMRDTYVDDVCTSVKTVKEGLKLTEDIDKVLAEGGFKIKEWTLSTGDRDSKMGKGKPRILGSKGKEEKVLGVKWNHEKDQLVVDVKLDDKIWNDRITKRRALAVIAQVFDPVGFVAPVIVRLKMKMQELWEIGVDWNEDLPDEIQQEWKCLFRELQRISDVGIPRCLTPASALDQVDLIIFCDASEKAFGSCAYLRWRLENGQFETRFVAGKSRVAPLKKLSVPRLELQAAVMAARMGLSIVEELSLTIKSKMHFTDSMIVLSWIKKPVGSFKQFVAARVTEIQNKTKPEEWRHVPGAQNPADDISRGIPAESLEGRWLKGPAFLLRPVNEWPNERIKEVKDDKEEKPPKLCQNAEVNITPSTVNIEDCQTWKEVLDIHRKKIYGEQCPVLDADKESDVEQLLLRRIQKESFGEEYRLLQSGKNVQTGSRLANLDPQFDKKSELIKVGGRLRRAKNLEIDSHPVLLDPSHRITKLLVRRIDSEVFSHSAGSEQVFAYLRRRYWILKGRSLIKSELRKCQQCQYWRKKPKVPMMADLPEARLRVGKPAFFSTGMDCFGPYAIKLGRRQEKRWGILFKCMTTKAVHLELVSAMDADAFLMAFRRFTMRKGKPKELYSDCGTNFTGAERELKECFNNMSTDLKEKLAEQQVKFHFNPPSAPHFGGTWEREVKSVKTALRCCLKERVVPEAVLQTVIVEVEGLINSKPLGYVSSDVADVDPITPNVLLMGRKDPALPLVTFDVKDELRSKRQWRHSQVIIDLFWKRFISEYLPDLQVRQKWLKGPENLKLGEKVLIVDNQVPRGNWLIGEVTQVYPSQDLKVRVADVKANNGKVYKRPVVKLVRLDEWK